MTMESTTFPHSGVTIKPMVETENDYGVSPPEPEEKLCDCNNRDSGSESSSFITIDETDNNEEKEDSLLEFDVGSVQSDGSISESAIEDDGDVDHLLNSIKAEKDELINRLNETISSVKMTSNVDNHNISLIDDMETILFQDNNDSENLRSCLNTTLYPGRQEIIRQGKSSPIDRTLNISNDTYVNIIKDRDDTMALIKNTSSIPLVDFDNYETNDANDTMSNCFNDSNISTSTAIASEQRMPCDSPLHETLPPAVRILQNGDSEPDTGGASSKCREAYTSLSQVLTNETLGNMSTKELLRAFDNKLENGLDKDKQMLESMRSQIDDDSKSFFNLDNDDPLNDLLLSWETNLLEETVVANHTILTTDNNDNTLKCLDNNESRRETMSVKNVDSAESKISVIVTVGSMPRKQENESDLLSSDDEELGGTVINVDEDEEKLLASDDELNVKVETKSDLKEFVSQSQEENNDINDPQWESLRKCKTEIEFFQAVRTRWKNLSKPNPREDLTCHTKRRINNRSLQMFTYKNEYGKRTHSPEKTDRSTKIPRRESCTYLFDTNIKNLMKNTDAELNRINNEKRLRLDELANKQMREERYATVTRQKFDYFHDMRLRQIRETEDLLAHFDYKRHCVTEATKQKIAALNEASIEVRQFFKFYYCDEVDKGEVNMCLTEIEKREIIELENMLDAYNVFYKPNSD